MDFCPGIEINDPFLASFSENNAFPFIEVDVIAVKGNHLTDWSTRDDIKANLQVDLILLLDEFDYPPVTIDDVYKEVLEQAENFKKYAQ